MKEDMYMPALWAGLASGFLSGFPLFSLGNCLCCLWIVGGGVLASYLYQRRRGDRISSADGMMVGAMAGLVSSLLATVLDMVFAYWSRDLILKILEAYGAEASPLLNYQSYFTPRGFASTLLIRIVIFSLFASIGGALGAAAFKPKAYGHN